MPKTANNRRIFGYSDSFSPYFLGDSFRQVLYLKRFLDYSIFFNFKKWFYSLLCRPDNPNFHEVLWCYFIAIFSFLFFRSYSVNFRLQGVNRQPFPHRVVMRNCRFRPLSRNFWPDLPRSTYLNFQPLILLQLQSGLLSSRSRSTSLYFCGIRTEWFYLPSWSFDCSSLPKMLPVSTYFRYSNSRSSRTTDIFLLQGII